MDIQGIVLCLILVATLVSADIDMKPVERGRQILIFGGNGFLGSATIEKFINNGDNVTMVNRGNWYWDSFNRVKPYVGHVSCDRKNGVESCEDLVELVQSVEQFDVVVDFSAYDGNDTETVGTLLKGKVGLYILISTDSIYDVCQKSHDEKTKETDDKRMESEEEDARMALYHEYGHKKKLAEEELLKHHEKDGFPVVILRLADVVGPRDSTYRWWIYQTWVKIAEVLPSKPVSVPKFLQDYHMSLVYSEDVATLIFDLPQMPDELFDETYNLAFEETLTLKEVIEAIQKELNIDGTEIIIESNHTETLYLYPTVKRGPIDITKAQEKLEWTPTPFTEAASKITNFYEEAMKGKTFETQKDELIQMIAYNLYPQSKIKFYVELEKIYELNLSHFIPRDEL